MKFHFVLFFLPLYGAINAQDCNTSVLFKKGTELEYKTYAPKGGLFSKGDFFEITKLIFIVQDVKDSNNVKYSFITKMGINPNDDKLKYQKNYIIPCDGNKIQIPIDFYGVDTIYFSNVYSKVTKDKGIYSSAVYKGKCIYNFPTDFDKNKFETSGNQVTMNMKIRDYEMAFTQQNGSRGIQNAGPENTGRIVENTLSMDMTIKKNETKGKEKISTSSGVYDCYKIVITTDAEVLGRGLNTNTILYYDTEVGFVKSESQQSKNKSGYTEIVRIKR